jgi:SAM-dependent methyltransferase
MSAIHPSAAKGYAKKAEAYDRGRPDYPAEVDQWLRGDLGLCPSSAALDLGAGTGKFTRRLLATGANVTAIEPVPAMREILSNAVPNAETIIGTAEDIPLNDETMDAVICAQSFHWFATIATLAEIKRVLKPGGVLGLVWNVRDERMDWVAALTTIMSPFAGEAPRYHDGSWRTLFPAKGSSPLQEKLFAHGHTGSPETVIIDRVLSISFIAALPPTQQLLVETQLQDLIEATPTLAGKAEVTFPYMTIACRCTKTG